MPGNSENAMKKRVADIIKARDDPEKKGELGFRGGRTWPQIADAFSTKVMEEMRKCNKTSMTIPGRTIREMVGDPDNLMFRERCLIHGVRLRRDDYTNAYNVSTFSVVERELKKRGKT